MIDVYLCGYYQCSYNFIEEIEDDILNGTNSIYDTVYDVFEENFISDCSVTIYKKRYNFTVDDIPKKIYREQFKQYVKDQLTSFSCSDKDIMFMFGDSEIVFAYREEN